MERATRDLSEYVKWVMKLKGLTQKDVERMSDGGITGAYVGSITTGRAGNPSMEKIKALAAGLGVDVYELFHVACGLPEEIGQPKSSHTPDALMILETVQKAVMSPEVTEILNEAVCLSPEERADLLTSVRRIAAMKKSRRKNKRT